MLGAYKKHPQAYLLYVEDCFLLSDNADVSRIFKSAVCKGLPVVAAHKLILAAAEINTRRISTATDGRGFIQARDLHQFL